MRVVQFINSFNKIHHTVCGAVLHSAGDVGSGAAVPGKLPGPSP